MGPPLPQDISSDLPWGEYENFLESHIYGGGSMAKWFRALVF